MLYSSVAIFHFECLILILAYLCKVWLVLTMLVWFPLISLVSFDFLPKETKRLFEYE